MKFLKFFFSGILTYAINIGLTYLLVKQFGIEKYISYAIALLIVTFFNFSVSLLFTFKKKYTHILMMRYLGTLIFFSLLNYLIVLILQDIFVGNLYYGLIFLVTTGIFFLKFKVYDNFVFK